jgi:hypothetical protein
MRHCASWQQHNCAVTQGDNMFGNINRRYGMFDDEDEDENDDDDDAEIVADAPHSHSIDDDDDEDDDEDDDDDDGDDDDDDEDRDSDLSDDVAVVEPSALQGLSAQVTNVGLGNDDVNSIDIEDDGADVVLEDGGSPTAAALADGGAAAAAVSTGDDGIPVATAVNPSSSAMARAVEDVGPAIGSDGDAGIAAAAAGIAQPLAAGALEGPPVRDEDGRVPPGVIAPEALVPSGNPFEAQAGARGPSAPAPEVASLPTAFAQQPSTSRASPPAAPGTLARHANSSRRPDGASAPAQGGRSSADARAASPGPGGGRSSAGAPDAAKTPPASDANWWKVPEHKVSDEELPPPPATPTDEDALSAPPALSEQAPLPAPKRGSVAAAAAAFEARSANNRS